MIQEYIISGRYRIQSILGYGGGSVVYLAEDTKQKVYRAVKCFSKTRSMHLRFHLEANLLYTLKNPFIPKFYEAAEDPWGYYLIEEYICGESLEAYVLHHRVSQEFILWIALKLCEFFQNIHESEPAVLYLDLKPEHIIVCEEEIKIIDFGAAIVVGEMGNHCQNFGTKNFAAPEQYRKGASPDVRANIYGLGAVLDFLLHHAQKNVSRNLKKIIKKAKRKSPRHRYQTIQELAEALKSNR